ncbi:MAG: hypothetical protein LBO82_03895 [Synergistaceae bacterium]|nr:hypothetical protein [Synergistaceae bacterium]
MYAAKHAVSSRKDLQRYNYLRRTAGLLAARGWDSGEKRRLLLFIERILYLKDESLSTQYREYRQQLSEEGKMMYIPFYERSDAEKVRLEGIEKGIERGIERGIEKGIERGIERGKEEMARKLLVRGDYAPEVISEIAGLPLDRIRALMN